MLQSIAVLVEEKSLNKICLNKKIKSINVLLHIIKQEQLWEAYL